MQFELQPVEKVSFSKFAWAFAPKMLEIGLPRLGMTWSFLQGLSRAVSSFSRGGVAGNHRQHVFDPTRSSTITISDRIEKKKSVGDCNPVGSKKCWRWFPATGSLEKRETALDRSWRKSQVILSRGRPVSNIFGANVHVNVLKGTFFLQRTANSTA